ERKIGAAMTGAHWVSPHLDLRKALESKGQRYGIVDTPYLIVVADCKGSIGLGNDLSEALIDALFGSQAVICRQFLDGTSEVEQIRRTGFGGGMKNRAIAMSAAFSYYPILIYGNCVMNDGGH